MQIGITDQNMGREIWNEINKMITAQIYSVFTAGIWDARNYGLQILFVMIEKYVSAMQKQIKHMNTHAVSHTNKEIAPNNIIHKKSAVRLWKGPFSSWTPYLALQKQEVLIRRL